MSSLLKSRWAPLPEETKTTTTCPSPSKPSSSPVSYSTLLSPAQELARFMKIVARLKWKLPCLEEGYRLATLPTSHGVDVDVAHAEIMFKIDFHEYYALLERAIVHLLGVFGVMVTRTGSSGTRNTGQGVQWVRPPSQSHRYHANVLRALQEERSPLHSVLGKGVVFEQLKKAKELRNRWKTADMVENENGGDGGSSQMEQLVPLERYDVDKILMDVFGGLEEGYLLAQAHVARTEGMTKVENEGGWDFIVDAMDWEAV
ncbi:hypothetical protein EYZ11_003422 [Aspergillus tanneri]|uniref:Uncharacterized protein n=1 Tax=Aspergillus tanneri TaxID=1220188 RepID=A0A4V3UQ03_9EURO|nr:uncharacterized protein ATNIH1004_010142 [Aspergillus tanneri]KAA8643373.1 hypothetical protein ATNIH1004_010142 [Aspergillus tanneri]THC97104.1 hypothetical protein EYZ11_003422 [Aspergillus tanneri]